ncbi:MAG: hypothetical protein F6K47_34570 [Symploca sp. SIO2E6]|nr:hypothetical protein [Symploca sp. SIO2E6]
MTMENTELNKNSEEQVVDDTSGAPNALGDEQTDSQETVTTPETEVKDGVSDESVETGNKDTEETAETEDSNTTIGERSPGKTDRGL